MDDIVDIAGAFNGRGHIAFDNLESGPAKKAPEYAFGLFPVAGESLDPDILIEQPVAAGKSLYDQGADEAGSARHEDGASAKFVPRDARRIRDAFYISLQETVPRRFNSCHKLSAHLLYFKRTI